MTMHLGRQDSLAKSAGTVGVDSTNYKGLKLVLHQLQPQQMVPLQPLMLLLLALQQLAKELCFCQAFSFHSSIDLTLQEQRHHLFMALDDLDL